MNMCLDALLFVNFYPVELVIFIHVEIATC